MSYRVCRRSQGSSGASVCVRDGKRRGECWKGRADSAQGFIVHLFVRCPQRAGRWPTRRRARVRCEPGCATPIFGFDAHLAARGFLEWKDRRLGLADGCQIWHSPAGALRPATRINDEARLATVGPPPFPYLGASALSDGSQPVALYANGARRRRRARAHCPPCGP